MDKYRPLPILHQETKSASMCPQSTILSTCVSNAYPHGYLEVKTSLLKYTLFLFKNNNNKGTDCLTAFMLVLGSDS